MLFLGARVRRLVTHPTEQSWVVSAVQGNNEVTVWDLETGARRQALWASHTPPLSQTQVCCRKPERATPILGLCHCVFTDQFIFRHILGHFSPRKWNLHHVYERIRSIRYQKGKNNVLKRQKLSFLGLYILLTGLWDLKDILNSRQNRPKNKLVRENAVTRVHGICPLRLCALNGRADKNTFDIYCFLLGFKTL